MYPYGDYLKDYHCECIVALLNEVSYVHYVRTAATDTRINF